MLVLYSLQSFLYQKTHIFKGTFFLKPFTITSTKINIAFQFDNNNPGLWRMGGTEDPMYLATTDFPYPQRFDINTLETLELLRPTSGFGMSGCTHWQREPGTDNSINFAVKV